MRLSALPGEIDLLLPLGETDALRVGQLVMTGRAADAFLKTRI